MADICIWFAIFLVGLICGLAVPPNKKPDMIDPLPDDVVDQLRDDIAASRERWTPEQWAYYEEERARFEASLDPKTRRRPPGRI